MYAVIITGAPGNIGTKLAHELSLQKSLFERAAFLTPFANAGREKEARYAKVRLARVVGSLSDLASYKGFDLVISAVGDDLCAKQPKFIDAAFAAGVKHFIPGEYSFDIAYSRSKDEAYF